MVLISVVGGLANKEFFDRWAESYSTHLPYFPEFRKIINRVVDTVAEHTPNKGKVLEVGMGTGLISQLIAQLRSDIEIYGNDVSPEMLKRVDRSKFLSLQTHCCDMDEMPYQDNQFDAIYANFVIHHKEDKTKVIRDIYRFLKPDGQFVLGEVVVDVSHTDEDFLHHVIDRWGYTARHALKHSDGKAVRIELEVMKRVYERNGEFLETPSRWQSYLTNEGFVIDKHEVIADKLGYNLFICRKSGD